MRGLHKECLLMGWLLFAALQSTLAQVVQQNDPIRVDYYGDPLPESALARMGTIRLHYRGPVYDVAFSPDGRQVAAGGYGPVAVWDTTSGRPVRTWYDYYPQICRSAFSYNGKLLACGLDDGSALLFEVSSPDCQSRLRGHEGTVICVGFTPDDKALVTIAANGSVRWWDVDRHKELRRASLRQTEICALSLSSDCRTVVSGDSKGKVRLWDTTNGREVREFDTEGWTDKAASKEVHIESVLLSTSGRFIASGSSGDPGDGSICLLDRTTGKRVSWNLKSEMWVSGLAFSPDEKTLAVTGFRKNMSVWEVPTGRFLGELPASGRALKFSPDGSLICSSDFQGNLQLWRLSDRQATFSFPRHASGALGVAFTPEGKRIVTLGQDCTLRVWNASSGKQQIVVQLKPAGMVARSVLAVRRDGKVVFAADGAGRINSWDLATGKELQSASWRNAKVWSLALHRDGNILAVELTDNERKREPWIELVDLCTGKTVRSLQMSSGLPTESNRMNHARIAFSPDGHLLAAAGWGTEPYIWDTASGREVRRLKGQPPTVYAVAFSPDGKVLAASAYRDEQGIAFENSIRLWDVATGKEIQAIEGSRLEEFAMAFSPDGKTFCSLCNIGEIALWELATGTKILSREDRGNQVYGVAISPSGDSMVSAMNDGTALLWSLAPSASQDAKQSKSFEQLMRDLGSDDGAEAYRAVWILSTNPEKAIGFLKEYFRTRPNSQPDRIERLILDLNASDFKVRDAASKELASLGNCAEDGLRKALTASNSEEVHARARALLDKLDTRAIGGVESLMTWRAIWVLERIGNEDARAILRQLADKIPRDPASHAARAALERLRGKGTKGERRGERRDSLRTVLYSKGLWKKYVFGHTLSEHPRPPRALSSYPTKRQEESPALRAHCCAS